MAATPQMSIVKHLLRRRAHGLKYMDFLKIKRGRRWAGFMSADNLARAPFPLPGANIMALNLGFIREIVAHIGQIMDFCQRADILVSRPF
jgi:hypothetical protein